MKKRLLALLLLVAFAMPWVATAQTDHIVAGGTATNSYIPVYGLYTDSWLHTQTIYPASMLEDAGVNAGAIISSLTYELYSPASAAWTATFEVRLGSSANPAFTSTSFLPNTGFDLVYTGTLNATGSTMTVTFDNPYTYEGGNLVVDFKITSTGNYKSASFYGVSSPQASIESHTSGSLSGSYQGFIPTTHIYATDVALSCPKPTDFAHSNVTATSADLSWTAGGSETSWLVSVNGGAYTTVNSDSYALTGLTPATDYAVSVRALCGEGDTSSAVSTTFATLCDVITITEGAPFVENFNAISGVTYSSAGQMPNCWGVYNPQSAGNYGPHVVTYAGDYAYSPDGTNSLGMTAGSSSTYGTPKIAVLPNFTNAISTLEMTFHMITEGSTGTLEVGYVTSDDYNTTFTAIQSIPASTETTHSGYGGGREYTVSLATAPAEATNIAFKWSVTSSYYSVCLDNIQVNILPTCPKPTGAVAENIEARNATINWTSEAAAHQVQYRVSGETEWTVVNTNLLSGLAANTTYEFQVRDICGEGDTSAWSATGTFRTNCVAIETLPYTEDFEEALTSSSNRFDNCWRTYTTGTYFYPYVTTSSTASYVHSGTHYLYFNGSSYYYAATPEFDAALNTLQVSFWARKSSSNTTVAVGAMEDPNNIETFDTIAVYDVTSITYEQFNTYLNLYTGTAKHIAIRCSGYLYVDDFEVSPMPTCPEVGNLAMTDATESSITVDWTELGSATAWQLRVNDGEWNNVTAKPYTIEALEAATSYQISVRPVCSEGDTGNVTSASFATSCTIVTIARGRSLFQGFEDSYPATCWTVISNNTANDHSNASRGLDHVTSANALTPYEGDKCFRFSSWSTTSDGYNQYLITPQLNCANDIEVSYYYTGYGNYQDKIAFGYSTTTNDLASFTWSDTIVTNFNDAWREFSKIIPAATKYVAVSYVPGSSLYHAFIDKFSIIQAPTCFKPTDVDLASASRTSATLTWTSAAPAWEVAIRERGTDDWTTAATENANYTFEGLSHSTFYEFQVRGICSEDDTSNWSEPYTFMTACGNMVLPYTEGFENSDANTMPACWTSIYGSNKVENSSSSAASGNNSLRIGGPGVVATPYIGAAANNLALSFDLRIENPNNSGNMLVAFVTDTTNLIANFAAGSIDPTSVAVIDTINNFTSNDELRSYAYSTDSITDLTDNGWLVFAQINTTSTYWYYWLDNLHIEALPSCRQPANLQLDSATMNTATLSWASPATDFEVLYRVLGETEWDTAAANTNSIILTGLNSHTSYEFQVRAFCDEEDTSAWSNIATFTTECGYVIVEDGRPYTESFEDPYPTDCWTFVNTYATINPMDNTAVAAYDGTQSLMFTSYDNADTYDQYAITPELVTYDKVYVSFQYMTAYSDENETFAVGYSTTGNDIADFIWHDTLTTAVDDWTNYLDTVPENTKYIAIHYFSECQYDLYVDAFELTSDGSVPCQAPTDVTAANATTNSVIVSWEGLADEYEISVYNDNEDYRAIATVSPYTFTGLQPNTHYWARVRTICSEGDTSAWSASSEPFTTEEDVVIPCNTPENLTISNVTANSAVATWEGSAAKYEVSLNGNAQVVTENTFTFSGLTAETAYTVKVRAICGDGDTSAWTPAVNFTTLAEEGIEDVTAANSISIYPNPANGNTTITIEGINGKLNIAVVDMNGRVAMTETVECNQGCTKQIDVNNLAQGAYFVRIYSEGFNTVKKLIVR